jgi:hypothetical protein
LLPNAFSPFCLNDRIGISRYGRSAWRAAEGNMKLDKHYMELVIAEAAATDARS